MKCMACGSELIILSPPIWQAEFYNLVVCSVLCELVWRDVI